MQDAHSGGLVQFGNCADPGRLGMRDKWEIFEVSQMSGH